MFFFFNDTATTEIYTLSLHDALPISKTRNKNTQPSCQHVSTAGRHCRMPVADAASSRCYHHALQSKRETDNADLFTIRSEEHTSELQSQSNLVCRLLLETTTAVPMVL